MGWTAIQDRGAGMGGEALVMGQAGKLQFVTEGFQAKCKGEGGPPGRGRAARTWGHQSFRHGQEVDSGGLASPSMFWTAC